MIDELESMKNDCARLPGLRGHFDQYVFSYCVSGEQGGTISFSRIPNCIISSNTRSMAFRALRGRIRKSVQSAGIGAEHVIVGINIIHLRDLNLVSQYNVSVKAPVKNRG